MERECHENENWYEVQQNSRISSLDRSASGLTALLFMVTGCEGLKNAKFHVTNTTGSRCARQQGQARSYIYLQSTACAGCLSETACVRDLSFHAHKQRWVQTIINSVPYEQLRPAWSAVMSSFVWLRRKIKSSAAENFKQIISSCSRRNARSKVTLLACKVLCSSIFLGGGGGGTICQKISLATEYFLFLQHQNV